MSYLKFFLIFLALIPLAVSAATRDFPVAWTHDCLTVDGDSLDADGDGVCEGLAGFRVFDAETGELLADVSYSTLNVNLRYNTEWGTQCHYAVAYMADPLNPGSELVSAPSNTAACKDVIPGNPKSPNVTN